jgi:threonine/homoserine/homoserine lactone efflux protein
MVSAYLAFAALAALVVVSPGPAAFLLLKNTPVLGRRVGLLNTAGIVAAVLSHAALSLLGVSAIILASQLGFAILKLAAAGYLAWLGVTALRDAWRGTDYSARLEVTTSRAPPTSASAFAEGWLTNILNPKPSMFYLSVFPQFLDPSGDLVLQGFALAGLHATISAAWFSFVVISIDRVRHWLRKPAIWRGVKAMTGLVLIGLALRLAALRFPA